MEARRGRHRGFTLLELMAGAAVMALLLAVGIPSYRAILNSQKDRTAVADLRSIGLQAEKYALGHDASIRSRWPKWVSLRCGIPGGIPINT